MSESTEVIFQVNSFRVPCVGVAPMHCLQVKRGDPASDAWQLFYTNIEGFEFEPGFRYRLRVRETRLPPETVPADASSIRYELIEIIEKVPDPNTAIHDIWVLERIDGTPIDAFDPASRKQAPTIEFNITRGTFMGNDGCNPIEGELVVTEAPQLHLIRNDDADATHSCGDDLLQVQFAAALDRAATWERDGLRLALMDTSGGEVLSFGKTD